MNNKDGNSEQGELVLYATEDGGARFFLHAENGTVWLTQLELAELFQSTKQNISLHIKNVLAEDELPAISVAKEDLTTAEDGKRYRTKLYSLDMILAVGYRVKSARGTQFRRWATTHLKQYLVKGFVIDDARLKDPGGWDYFDELLQRIREIRASEKRFYQKVRDLFALSSDYQDNANLAGRFFAELRVRQRKVLSMADWRKYVDNFLEFNESPLLHGAGRISHDAMVDTVHERYAQFDGARRQLEAAKADDDDLKALEQAEKLLTKKDGRDDS